MSEIIDACGVKAAGAEGSYISVSEASDELCRQSLTFFWLQLILRCVNDFDDPIFVCDRQYGIHDGPGNDRRLGGPHCPKKKCVFQLE